jgi:hypothetical protein
MAPEIILDTGHNFAVDWCARVALSVNRRRHATHVTQVVPWNPHLRDARGSNAVRSQGQEANVPLDNQKRSGVPCQLPPACKGLVQQAALVCISPSHAAPHPCALTRHAAKRIKAAWGRVQGAGATCKRIRTSAGSTGRRCCRGTSPWTRTGSPSLTSAMACRLVQRVTCDV